MPFVIPVKDFVFKTSVLGYSFLTFMLVLMEEVVTSRVRFSTCTERVC